MNDELFTVISNFNLVGNIISLQPFGSGHINKTYHVVTDKEEYILQTINNYAFKDVDVLMKNIDIVTSFISHKGQKTLDIIKTKKNELYYQDDNKYYRVYRFIKDTICYETVGTDLSLAYKLGNAFGKLHLLLEDLDPNLVKETIVDFHNTRQRYLNFSNAFIYSPKEKRVLAKKEIGYILNHNKTYSWIVNGMKKGDIKKHIIHNDPKINNVLFDKTTHNFLAVIDLDTVMPGSVLYDIGDSFRSLFTGENEDNPDLSLQKVNIDIFKEYMTGYLKEMKDYLTPREKELIPYSIYLMTIECGMRFLEDYLRGNVYFHVAYETHNLIRAKTQIALADDVLKNMDRLSKVVKEILKTL